MLMFFFGKISTAVTVIKQDGNTLSLIDQKLSWENSFGTAMSFLDMLYAAGDCLMGKLIPKITLKCQDGN